MFHGTLSDLLIYSTSLTTEDATLLENLIRAEHANYVSTTSGYTSTSVSMLDSDVDTLPDWWEIAHYGTITQVKGTDLTPGSPKQQFTHRQEFLYGTNPRLADTDEDGLSDYMELKSWRTSPTSWDTDNDLLPDSDPAELKYWRTVNTIKQYKAIDPTNGRANSDGQGFTQGWDHLIQNFNVGQDSDGDGLSDLFEVAWLNSRPDFAEPSDSDGDSIADAWEIAIFGNLTTVGLDAQGNQTDHDGDGILDRDEAALGLNAEIKETDLNGDSVSDAQTDPITPDDQGRILSVGNQTWGYDAEGNVIQKN
jgi:hypothetical protein